MAGKDVDVLWHGRNESRGMLAIWEAKSSTPSDGGSAAGRRVRVGIRRLGGFAAAGAIFASSDE